MSDYERYGDYNDIEDDRGHRSRNPILFILKLMVALVCITVVGIIGFRLIIFNNYPEDVSRVYFNDKLTEYYESLGGEVEAKTQTLRFPYDDEDLGNFFCDHLIVIEDIDQLQITVRYNTGSLERIADDNGLDAIDDGAFDIFTFRLRDNNGVIYDNVTAAVTDSQVMYRYIKLVFDDVELTPNTEGVYPEWIRLEITVKGSTTDKVYMIPVYENHEKFNDFSDYKIEKIGE